MPKMKQSNIPLNDMSLFIEVGRALSFTKAAKTTGIPHSTLSRRIKSLEKSIGLRLFNRTTRKIEFTEAGEMYYAKCKPLIDEVKIAHEQLNGFQSKPKGLLRALLPVDLATTYIAPLMPEFCRSYPEITYDLELSSKSIDLVKDHYDLAIKVGELNDSIMITQLIGKLPLYLYASPDYLQKQGEPKTPEELESRECLTIIYNTWTLYSNGQSRQITPTSRFKLNNLGMMRQLIAIGLGIGLLPKEVARADVEQGRLVRIMHPWQGMDAPVYAITESRLMPQKTRVFIDYLRSKLSQQNE